MISKIKKVTRALAWLGQLFLPACIPSEEKFRDGEYAFLASALVSVAVLLSGYALALWFLPMVMSPLAAAAMTHALVILGLGLVLHISPWLPHQIHKFRNWWQHRHDENIIKKTNPTKYQPCLVETAGEEADNQFAAMTFMRKLYNKKQEIKQNPEGWIGLSEKQERRCALISQTVGFFRENPYHNSDSIEQMKDVPESGKDWIVKITSK